MVFPVSICIYFCSQMPKYFCLPLCTVSMITQPCVSTDQTELLISDFTDAFLSMLSAYYYYRPWPLLQLYEQTLKNFRGCSSHDNLWICIRSFCHHILCQKIEDTLQPCQWYTLLNIEPPQLNVPCCDYCWLLLSSWTRCAWKSLSWSTKHFYSHLYSL